MFLINQYRIHQVVRFYAKFYEIDQLDEFENIIKSKVNDSFSYQMECVTKTNSLRVKIQLILTIVVIVHFTVIIWGYFLAEFERRRVENMQFSIFLVIISVFYSFQPRMITFVNFSIKFFIFFIRCLIIYSFQYLPSIPTKKNQENCHLLLSSRYTWKFYTKYLFYYP